MTNEETSIAQFIIETVRTSPDLSGAALGSKVRHQFPNAFYGQLARFIKQHCSDTVVGRLGEKGDYIWGLKSTPTTQSDAPSEVASQSAMASIKMEATPLSAWKVFVRYDTLGKLLVDPINCSVSAAEDGQEASFPLIEVQGVTLDEYKIIASKFVNTLDEADQPRFRLFLERPKFDVPQWYSQICDWRGGHYSKAWGGFRFQSLCKIFVERLRSQGLAEDVIAACLKSLKHQKLKYKDQSSISSNPGLQSIMQQPSFHSMPALRTIAINAIGALSDDELRQVWLPLGVVIDAIRKP